MEAFNPITRKQNLSWSIIQIKLLLNQVEKQKSSTILSYAALECRIIIERLELTPLVMAASSLENDSWMNEIEQYKGIQRVNSRLKSLRFRYQTFTAAFSDAMVENCPLVPFDFTKAEDLQSRLAKYLHVYNKSDDDFLFGSEFVQEGINIVKETLEFLENSCAKDADSYVQGIIDFETVSPEIKNEFNDWVKRKDEDVIALTNRLIKIREKSGSKKIIIN